MKIGFFIPSYLPNIGGAEIALHNYLINLNQNKKLSVYLLISFEAWVKMKLNRVTLPYQVKVIYFPLIFRVYKYTPSVAKFVMSFFLNFYHKKLKINIWHIIMMYPTATICCDYFSNKGIPWVVRAIGVDIQTHKKLKYGYRINNEIDSLIVNKGTKASAYIASSKDVLKEYLALNIHSSKLYEIPNSVKLSLFENSEKLDNKFRKKYKISQDEKIFLTVGRNHKKKGFSILLKAIKNFKNRNKLSRAKFVFYGTNLISLKKISIDLNISKDCIFLEEKNNLSDFYDYFPNKQLREVYLNADFFTLIILSNFLIIALITISLKNNLRIGTIHIIDP